MNKKENVQEFISNNTFIQYWAFYKPDTSLSTSF